MPQHWSGITHTLLVRTKCTKGTCEQDDTGIQRERCDGSNVMPGTRTMYPKPNMTNDTIMSWKFRIFLKGRRALTAVADTAVACGRTAIVTESPLALPCNIGLGAGVDALAITAPVVALPLALSLALPFASPLDDSGTTCTALAAAVPLFCCARGTSFTGAKSIADKPISTNAATLKAWPRKHSSALRSHNRIPP